MARRTLTPVEAVSCVIDPVASAPLSIVALRWMHLGPAFSDAAAVWPVLDSAEQACADRFRANADRDAYIAAHALLRLTLSETRGIAPHEWRFRVADNGKPEVDPMLGQPGLKFSLSHTRGMVACVVGHGHDLGVDVEALDPALEIVEIAQRFFAPAEVALIAGAVPAQQPDLFYRVWTLKEAYLKATGEGMAGSLEAFAFSLNPVSVSFASGQEDPADWQFAEFTVGPSHRLAMAIRRPAVDPGQIDAAATDLSDALDRVTSGRREKS
jgi:4'-phosphopantetheinyl transferase